MSSNCLKIFIILAYCELTALIQGEHIKNELIVRYSQGTTDFQKNQTAIDFNLTLVKSLRLTNASRYLIDSNESLLEIKAAMEQLNFVKYVSFNKIIRKQSFDPEFGLQWYMENTGQQIDYIYGTSDIDIGWKDAMQNYSKKSDTNVAIADSGFARDHQELSGRELSSIAERNGLLFHDDDGNGYVDDVSGWDFIDNDPDPYDFQGHGTQVSSIICSNNDSVGVQGIAPDAYIMPLRVLNSQGRGSLFSTVEALEYVYYNSAFRIINLSLGSLYNEPLLNEIIKAFEQDDYVLLICAAGNGGSDYIGDDNDLEPYYPASYNSSSIISVGSIGQRGNLSDFSNYGKNTVDIVAPGENIRVATIRRELSSQYPADGSIWRENFWWTDSISQSYSRKLYGYDYWLESPRNYTMHSSLFAPSIDLGNTKDPRLKIHMDYYLSWKDSLFLNASNNGLAYQPIRSFSKYSSGGYRLEEFDISEFAGENLYLQFSFFPTVSSSYFDVGGLEIWDIDTDWNGSPYYEFNNGTSFSAPVVSGVAALIMSHRPDLLASDIKNILLDSVKKIESLSGKIKSGGMVRADKAIHLANTYKRRSQVKFTPLDNQNLTTDLKIKVKDNYLTFREMTAGILDGQGHYFEGDTISIKATPSIGFNFDGWEENGKIISTDESYTFTSGFKNYIFKARFTEDLSDPDSDKFPNYAEAIYGTNIDDPDSDDDQLNDYDEWFVAFYGSSLDLLEDDSSTISLLEEIVGADSYFLGISEGKEIGRKEGLQSVLSNPSAYNLFTSEQYEELIKTLDTNATPYTSSWFYTPKRGWMWTKMGTYPYFFHHNTSNWMYFQSGHENPRFYHYGTKKWMTLE